MRFIIGIDFDNTIVSYDEAFFTLAVEQKLIGHEVAPYKKYVRDEIRKLSDGDIAWQKLQAQVYGPDMWQAKVIPGVKTFFENSIKENWKIFIISHKTEFAKYDQTKTNLRSRAITWLTENHFFQSDGGYISPDDLFFESTRREKIERIRQLGCTHFIDDLPEVFLEKSFPPKITKILYSSTFHSKHLFGIKTFSVWHDINEYFLKIGN